MVHYHVRLSVTGEKRDEVKNDLTPHLLERQFLTPYRRGELVTVNGKTMSWDDIERIRISATQAESGVVAERLKQQDSASSVLVVGGPSYGSRVAAAGEDVTDQFITGPPGVEAIKVDEERVAPAEAHAPSATSTAPRADSVFVVAGRDSLAATAINIFLRAIGLRIVEWEHAVALTGLPNPYVGDVVEAGLQCAGAAVVLLTPDDLVHLRNDLVRESDGSEERTVQGQARPNVYYEAGIADALGRNRTVIVELGSIKSFTDAAGRHVVRYDGSAAMRHTLAERLKIAGLAVNTAGSEWLSAGDVTAAIQASRTALENEASVSTTLSIEKTEALAKIEAVLELHEEARKASKYSDLSDLPDGSLDIAFRAQALLDGFAAESPFAAEAERVRKGEPHQRIPILMAALRAVRVDLRADLEI